ncbi:MAG: PAS domain-containing protein [Micromonosporaceae bacterium]|nr:PAS domain-containing protein [Micromonosporaceae bacterium]
MQSKPLLGDPAPQDASSVPPVVAVPRGAFSADDYLAVLGGLLEPMARALGGRTEVVLHDFRRPEHSIVAIAGDVTGRHPGGSVTEIGLAIIRAGDEAEESYNYTTQTPDGRVLKSSTVPLRDAAGRVFGALCVNVDITEMRMMSRVLQDMIGIDAVTPRPVTFVDDIDRVIGEVLQEETEMLGPRPSGLTKPERLQLLKALDHRGVFSLQRSVTQVAAYLGLSRATLYNDLREMRIGKDDQPT